MGLFEEARAFHEAGHAVVSEVCQPYGRPVATVDIRIRLREDGNQSGGRTIFGDDDQDPSQLLPIRFFCRNMGRMAGPIAHGLAIDRLLISGHGAEVTDGGTLDYDKAVKETCVFLRDPDKAKTFVVDECIEIAQTVCSDYWDAICGVAHNLMLSKEIMGDDVRRTVLNSKQGRWSVADFYQNQLSLILEKYGFFIDSTTGQLGISTP